jgi:cell division septation protein DedD
VAIQFKRSSFIAITVALALLIIFVPLFVKDYRADILQSFVIPNLPAQPSPELLPMTPSQHRMHGMHHIQSLLSFPLAPAKAWVIELPDFKNPAEANALVLSLRLKGFKAYSRQFNSLTQVLTRVFVGPEVKPEQMKLIAERLNTEMHLDTKVVPFDPLLIK